MKQKCFLLLVDIVERKQYTPSKWMFSRVCDECIPLLYNKNAGQTCLKYTPKAGKHSISKGGSMHDYK